MTIAVNEYAKIGQLSAIRCIIMKCKAVYEKQYQSINFNSASYFHKEEKIRTEINMIIKTKFIIQADCFSQKVIIRLSLCFTVLGTCVTSHHLTELIFSFEGLTTGVLNTVRFMRGTQ